MSTKIETVNVGSDKKVRAPLLAPIIILVLLLGAAGGFALSRNSMSSELLTYHLSEPLGGVSSAKVEIDPGDGNLTIDQLEGGQPVLASGTLQYLETQGVPSASVNKNSGQTALILQASSGGGQPWIKLPWAACNGATDWQIHLNPDVQFDITAHTGGGNVKLNLAELTVSRVSADTGGGNMNVVLPDTAADLIVTVKTGAGDVDVEIGRGTTGSSDLIASSGAGNVVVQVPDGIAARIHGTSGMGKLMIDPRFSKIDDNTYQSPDYDSAANRVNITINSGAGNVSVATN